MSYAVEFSFKADKTRFCRNARLFATCQEAKKGAARLLRENAKYVARVRTINIEKAEQASRSGAISLKVTSSKRLRREFG